MRDLTIRRRKVFAGCLSKLKVYIEDPYSSEITVDNTPCRFLGRIKNGETQTFRIGDEAARIYVIADAITKDYSNEYYQLPEGTEDILLEGEVKLSPGNNMFRFDNNNSEGVSEKRKKGSRTGIAVLIGAIIVGAAAGGLLPTLTQKLRAAKTFSAEGMTITLTKAFTVNQTADYTSCYQSRQVIVMNLKEDFASEPILKTFSLEEYADAVLESSKDVLKDTNVAEAVLEDYNGIPGFEYDYSDPDSKESYHYRIYIFKTDDAFWLVQFATRKGNFSNWEKQIDKWVQSVTFAP